MKRISTLLFLLCASLTAVAVQPLRIFVPFHQPDGTVVRACPRGEGHVAFYLTEDGVVTQKDANGNLCYALLTDSAVVASGVLAHEAGERTANERTFLAQHAVLPGQALEADFQNQARRRAPRRAYYANADDGLGVLGKSALGPVPTIGSPVIPVIMVSFSDLALQETTTPELLNKIYNEEGYCYDKYSVGSVRDYFTAMSHGAFTPRFDVIGPVTLSNTYAYYGANTSSYSTGNYLAVAQDAINAAIDQLGTDFSQYVADDGYVPLVAIYYAGYGENEVGSLLDNGTDYLWPCEIEYHRTIGGVKFKSQFIGNELSPDYTYDSSTKTYTVTGNHLGGFGVFVHEFSHALGMPDVYSTNSSNTTEAMGSWDVMDYGCYWPLRNTTSVSKAPVGYTAYERSFFGWEDIPTLSTEADTLTVLRPFGSTLGANAARLVSPDDAKEYFILENRQPSTWFPTEQKSGLFVTHVAYDKSAWSSNQVNYSASLMRLTSVVADNDKSAYNFTGDVFGSNAAAGVASLTTTTSPALTYFTGSAESQGLYDITIVRDSLVAFSLGRALDYEQLVGGNLAPYFKGGIGCPFGLAATDTAQLASKLSAAQDDPSIASYLDLLWDIDQAKLPLTAGYYRLHNADDDTYLANAATTTSPAAEPASIYSVEAADEEAWAMSVNGHSVETSDGKADYPVDAGRARAAFALQSVEGEYFLEPADTLLVDRLAASDGKSFATLYMPFAYTLPDGTTAYTAASLVDGGIALSALADTIAAATPVVIINSRADEAVNLSLNHKSLLADDEDAADNNKAVTSGFSFLGAYEETAVDVETTYFLTGGSDGIGFRRHTTTTTLPYRAYVQLASADKAPALALIIDGQTTGIHLSPATSQTTFAAAYDLQGRRLQQPRPGQLYIQGGRVRLAGRVE